ELLGADPEQWARWNQRYSGSGTWDNAVQRSAGCIALAPAQCRTHRFQSPPKPEQRLRACQTEKPPKLYVGQSSRIILPNCHGSGLRVAETIVAHDRLQNLRPHRFVYASHMAIADHAGAVDHIGFRRSIHTQVEAQAPFRIV